MASTQNKKESISNNPFLNNPFRRKPFVEKPVTMPASIPTTTPPQIFGNMHVVSICPTPIEKAGHREDGWFLSDFYAFNVLFRGLGTSQTWLATNNPQELVDKHGLYVHGNPGHDPKVVLSGRLLQNDKITPVTVVKKDQDIAQRFLDEVSRVTKAAKRHGGSVLLIVCSPGLDGSHFSFYPNILTLVRIQAVLEQSDVPVSLLSTASLSSGWSLTKDLNAAQTSARKDNLWWLDQPSISLQSSPIFVGSIFEALKSSDTVNSEDLLEALNIEQSDNEQSDNEQSDAKKQTSLDKTPAEIDAHTAYNLRMNSSIELCRSVNKFFARNSNTGFTDNHEFTFLRPDEYGYWSPSRQQPATSCLDIYSSHWECLETYTDNTSDASDVDSRHTTLAGRRHRFIRGIAEGMLQTCPGDECAGYGPLTTGSLKEFAEHGVTTMSAMPFVDDEDDEIIYDDWDIVWMARYRVQVARYIDYCIIDALGLPKPDGRTLLHWNKWEWQDKMVQDVRNGVANHDELRKEKSPILYYLKKHSFYARIAPSHLQGPPFYRILYYVQAAVYEARLGSRQAEQRIMDKMFTIVNRNAEYFETEANKDEGLRKQRQEYHQLMKRLERLGFKGYSEL